jgi:hypothetical protein
MELTFHASCATPEFKSDVERFLAGDRPERVRIESYVPRIKVQRLLTQLLHAEPALEIEHVVIRGSSGCSDFVGSIDVQTSTGAHVFDFAWCCRWRAEREGFVDYFGFPDQMRAAQEFGWQCFKQWDRRGSN